MRTILLLVLCLPGITFAMECESDSECGENERCQRSDIAIGAPCSIDSDGNEECPEPPEPEPGECVPGPIACESDADCPGISSCVEEPGGFETQDCAPAEDGEEVDCEPVTTQSESTSFCQFVPESCTESSDCAEGLTCSEVSSPCLDVPTTAVCPEDEECPEPEPAESACDEQEVESACIPEPILCSADSECPSDWTCETLVVSRGCGSSSTPIDGETTEPAMSGGSSGSSDSSNDSDGVPEPAEDDQDGSSDTDDAPPQMNESDDDSEMFEEEEDCEDETSSLCMPAGYEHYFGGGVSQTGVALGSNDDTATTTDTGGSESDSSDEEGEADATPSADSDSGCDCSTGKDTGLNSLWALVLLGVVFRRRLA